jgi:hypothetical protein
MALFEASRQAMRLVLRIEIWNLEVGERALGNAVAVDDGLANVGIAVAAKTGAWIPDGGFSYILPI